ncbi:MAG: hypothetical protein ABIP12_07210 [Terriglobales bacterium]
MLALFAACVLPATAQNTDDKERGQVGVFGEFFRFEALDANLGGLGGRLSFNVHPNIQLEGEMSYLFRRGFAESFSNGIAPFTSTPSSLRAINGLFGPRYQWKRRWRPFVTLKGGFLNTEFSDQSPGPGFTSQINNFRRASTVGTLYPGAGVEGSIGWMGLRFDIGDEIVFNQRRAHHNLRMTLGPFIRF